MLIIGSIVKEEKVGRVTDLAHSRSKDCLKASLHLWYVKVMLMLQAPKLMSGWNSFCMLPLPHVSAGPNIRSMESSSPPTLSS
jgi:hypothetical protein